MKPILKDLGSALEQIQKRAENMKTKATTATSENDSHNCPKCKDVGFILSGWEAVECSCLKQYKLQKRMKNAMIPAEFKKAEFETYKVTTTLQNDMLVAIQSYLAEFDSIIDSTNNSFGLISVYGEKKLKEIKNAQQRAEIKRKHNNFGLGKTHLQIAAAKELIQRGHQTIVISDVVFMEDLSKARMIDDEGNEFNRLLGAAIQTPVLVWDDIGKAKVSEFRLNMYYQVINERYRNQRPIIFSSNEDKETLAEKIGDAAASRLFGMSMNHLYEVEGVDYRTKGA
jgi:DNA replication protein DnaC